MRLRKEQKAQQVGWGGGVDEQKPIGENERPGGRRESDQSGVGEGDTVQTRTGLKLRSEEQPAFSPHS